MSTLTKNYSTLSVQQLKDLLKDVDGDREIRIWVEMEHNETIALEGRRAIGVLDDPNDPFCCIVAGYYQTEEEE